MVLGWVGTHARGFYAAVGLFLILGLASAAAAIVLFAGLAALVSTGQTDRFDRAVLLWVNLHATPRLNGFAVEISALGSAYVTAILVLIALALLWGTRHRWSAVLLCTAVSGGWVLNRLLKLFFDRPRPELFEWRVPYAGASSYPSGHSTTAMVVYATLAYLVIRLEPSRAARRITLLIFGAVVLMVGMSRVYIGVHYPSDVIGGYLVGFAWASICALGIEAVRYFRGRRPDVVREERDLERGILPITAGRANKNKG
jgi:membrane-associated phospholipid phosphatase